MSDDDDDNASRDPSFRFGVLGYLLCNALEMMTIMMMMIIIMIMIMIMMPRITNPNHNALHHKL